MSVIEPARRASEQDVRRRSRYVRTMQRLGHARWFAVMIKHAGCRLDRVLYRTTRGRVCLGGPTSPTMLLTTTGRRTGRPRTVPVLYVRDGRNLVAMSENLGLEQASSWPLNLDDDPEVSIQVGPVVDRFRARPATAEEISRTVPQLLEEWPAHDTYLHRSGVRRVFVFEPAG